MTKMDQKMPILNVYLPQQCKDPTKLCRILIYVIGGVSGISCLIGMLVTGIFTHIIMRTTQINEEKYRDELEPLPNTMRCKFSI